MDGNNHATNDADAPKSDVSPDAEGEGKMMPDGEKVLRAINNDVATEQQSTLSVPEDPASTVETLKVLDTLTTDVGDIDILDLPVVYAYEVGNEESKQEALQKQKEYYEELAKRKASTVATKKRGRPKSLPAPANTTKSESTSKKARASVTTASEIIDVPSSHSGVKYPIREPAPDEFLAGREGWIRETHNRSTNTRHLDKYWFTPKTNKKLRSVPEVRRFLELLDKMNGDEDAAYEKMKKK
jgi:hypothetical protein